VCSVSNHARAQLSGLDSVDDESKPEPTPFTHDSPHPQDWTRPDNPPHAYYVFYMYANLCTLNAFRRQRGFPYVRACARPHLRVQCAQFAAPLR
jgi:hypothetical protein